MSKNQALSLRSQWLGERLRAARDRAGYTLKDAGAYVGIDFTLVGRFERGTSPIRPAYIRDLIAFYGISSERERDALLKLNADAWRKDWWDGDTEDLEMGFLDYTWLEARADHIHVYDPLLINGLLQTEGYMRAMALADPRMTNAGPEAVDRMVELRTRRHRILELDEPTGLSVVFEEGAIRRTIGTPAVMRDQLEHLIASTERDNIVIQVAPTTLGWHAGLVGPFTYFAMRDPLPDVAYVESMTGRTFLEEVSKVDTHRQVYLQLADSALTPEDTVTFLKDRAKELK